MPLLDIIQSWSKEVTSLSMYLIHYFLWLRELHGNGDGSNTADFPCERCGNTAEMD